MIKKTEIQRISKNYTMKIKNSKLSTKVLLLHRKYKIVIVNYNIEFTKNEQ